MPRGGARPGSGPAPDPNSARSKAKAAKAAKQVEASAKQPKGFAPAGVKTPDAPAGWPFGTQSPAVPEPHAAAAPIDPDAEPVIEGGEPLDFLQAIINEKRLKLAVRMQAAALAVGFKHAKLAPMGKKEGQADAARKVSRFAQAVPPKLVASGGKKL